MTAALITAAASGGLLIVCISLFRYERSRPVRVFTAARDAFDRFVVRCSVRLARMQLHLGTGAMRVALHRILHIVFRVLVRVTDTLAAYFDRLRERNHRIARSVRMKQEKTYFDLIAEHKDANALTEAERAELKRRSIEGDVR